MPKKIIIQMLAGLFIAISANSFAEDPPPPTESPQQPQPPNLHGQVYYGPNPADSSTAYPYTSILGGWGNNDPYEGGPYNWGDTRVWVPGHTVVRSTHTEIVPGHWEYR